MMRMKKVFYCLVPGLLTVCFLLLGNVRGIAANANLAMISFTNFTPNPVAPGGHPTSIKFQVYNYGPASVGSSAHTLLDMYLSSNNIFGDGDDVNISTYNWGQSLPALSLTTATISGSLLMSAFTIPAGASGQYHLFLKISHTATSGLTDPDPSDNWAMLATTITVGSGDTTPPTHRTASVPLNCKTKSSMAVTYCTKLVVSVSTSFKSAACLRASLQSAIHLSTYAQRSRRH